MTQPLPSRGRCRPTRPRPSPCSRSTPRHANSERQGDMARKKYNAPVPKGMSTGLIPRNYKKHPVGYQAFAPAFPDSELIPEAEWADRLAENRAKKAGLLE